MDRTNENAYREAENKLYAEYGVGVQEHLVHVENPAASVRVLEVGQGEPILFIHGSPNNAATWIPLVSHLTDRRCLLLERPGAGLSSSVEAWGDHRVESVEVVESVLDTFEIEQADLVGSSFGGLYAYNVALARPERVRTLIQLGAPGGPTVLGMPALFRFLSLPVPKVVAKRALRPDTKEARKMFMQIGHEVAIKTGAIPEVVFDWYASLLRNTNTAENLFREIRAIATPFGFRPTARLDDTALADLTQPLLHLWGDEDAFATPDQADRLVSLTPGASIEHFEGFGHLLWYDDPALIAGRVDRFLTTCQDSP